MHLEILVQAVDDGLDHFFLMRAAAQIFFLSAIGNKPGFHQ